MRFLLFFILLIPIKISHDVLTLSTITEKLKVSSIPKSELKCLVDNAFYEARGEGHVGMLLVTQVVFNRAKQSNESYCQTIYKKNQFSWTVMKGLRKIPTETRKEIESLVLNVHYGLVEYVLPSHLSHALFYHANYVNPTWFKTRKKLGYWGNHVFYH
jgi:spore germination cell wall hydrolase CwlJ-like protein